MTDKFFIFLFCVGLFGFGVSLTLLVSGLRVQLVKDLRSRDSDK
jgi:hypothetical protein